MSEATLESEVEATLTVLLVEDDPEVLQQLQESLPDKVGVYAINWEGCQEFKDAIERVNVRRYDLIVTDIYRDRVGKRKGIDPADEEAFNILQAIRDRRFCPVIAFTDGSAPQRFKPGPFVRMVDKSGPDANAQIVRSMEELLSTGIPVLAKTLHDELDRATGSYLWSFLEANWERLAGTGLRDPVVLERVVRRRAAVQLSRLNPFSSEPEEMELVEGAEFYLWPSITGSTMRLGEILRHRTTGEFRVLLIPHCYLTIQANAPTPRADFVTTVKTVSARELISRYPCAGNTEQKKLKALRRYLLSPSSIGQPEGRYWFLPGFLYMPDL